MAPEPQREPLSFAAGAIASFWLGFASFIEREAGHTLMALCLIAMAVKIMDPATRAAAAHDLMVFSLGALAKGMGPGKPQEKP
jgi:hypothetical protein